MEGFIQGFVLNFNLYLLTHSNVWSSNTEFMLSIEDSVERI